MGPYTNNTVKNKHNLNMYMDALDYTVLCPYLDTRSDLYQIDYMCVYGCVCVHVCVYVCVHARARV